MSDTAGPEPVYSGITSKTITVVGDGAKELIQAMKDQDLPLEIAANSEGIAELIERLVIANLKLFAVCEEKKRLVDLEQSGQPVDQHELLDNIRKDLDLCRSRAAIRAEINKRLGSFSGEVVKTY